MSARDEITRTELRMDGTLTSHLSGRYLTVGRSPDPAAGPGIAVHAVELHAGAVVSYRRRLVNDEPSAPPDAQARPGSGTGIIEFAGRLLILRDGALAQELGVDLRPLGRVDLAGRGQGIGAHATLDHETGELHLLAAPNEPTAAHQAISSGAMRRHTRFLTDPPGPIHHLVVTRERLVVFAPGAVGVTSRKPAHPERSQWFPTADIGGDDVVTAFDDGPSVVVYVTGRALERWTFEPQSHAYRREVIDATPQRFGMIDTQATTAPIRYLYAVGGSTPRPGAQLFKHDLLRGTRAAQRFGTHCRPGALVFVRDASRHDAEDGGWLLGLVHDDAGGATCVVVRDAATLDPADAAVIHLPDQVPDGRAMWSRSRRPRCDRNTL